MLLVSTYNEKRGRLMNTAVVLFVYNRPEHTKAVLNGLEKNKLQKLYVFCDGLKKQEDFDKVEKTKNIVRNIDWCEVEFFENNKNLGLAQSVINGVSSIFKKEYDSIIVLEDDCVPNGDFLEFMNNSLAYYKDIPEVMHVSGFGLPIKKYTQADTYLTPYPCSWGWGTWKEVWQGCNFEQFDNYTKLLNDKHLKKEFDYPGAAFSEFLQMQLDGKVNSWLIRWYYYIFQNKGKCVWSYKTFIKNRGFDGSGVHKNKIDRFNQKNDNENKLEIFKFEDNLSYNKNLIREFRRHFMGKKYTEKIKTSIYLLTGIIIGK